MTPSRRSAIAAAAVCGVLWLALARPVRDEGEGSPVRPAAVEAPDERPPGAPELSAVTGESFLYARCGGEEGQDYSLRVALTLGEGEERFIDDRLTPTARIDGVALDRVGRPLASVDVCATGRRNGNLTRRATTDASGMYTLVGLYEGDYVLTLANNRVEKPLIVEVPAGGPVLEAEPLFASDT